MIIKAFKIITTVFIKSLLTSLYQREEFPSLVKRGKGRFSNQCQFNFETLNKKEAGFSLVELMITMVVFVFFIVAASQVFTGLLTQFKQQSKIAETNIEGIVGLEMLRQDVEHAGYGLPWHVIDPNGNAINWSQLANYEEATVTTYNDAPNNAPRAVISGNNVTFPSPNNIFDGTDYLVIKSASVARNYAAGKWTTLSAGDVKRVWTPERENVNKRDDGTTNNNVRVIVISPGASGTDQQALVAIGTSDPRVYRTTYNNTASFAPSTTESITRLIYGVDPDTDLRMPFNRADYFIRRFDSGGANITPGRCAPNTGILEKATVNQNGGGFTYLPLLDCVADMQVIYALDNNEDGSFDPSDPADGYSDDITTAPLTAQQIRKRVKQVRVYILSHEGQRDATYTYCPSSAASCSTAFPLGEFGLVSTFDLTTKIGDPDYKYYRWKLYTIVVTPHNLE